MMGAIRPFDRVYEIVIVLDFPSFSLIELDDQTRTERSIPMLWSEIEACCVLCLSSIVRHGFYTVLDLSQKFPLISKQKIFIPLMMNLFGTLLDLRIIFIFQIVENSNNHSW